MVTTFFMFAVVTAYFIKGLCGFGNTLMLTSIMAFRINNSAITPIDLLLGYPANLIQAYKNKSSANFTHWFPIALCVVLGNIPGAVMLKTLPVHWIKMLCGAAIIVISLMRIMKSKTPSAQSNHHWTKNLFWGILTGISCGLFGIGAFLAAYVGTISKNSHQFKGNLSMIFLIENTFRIVLFIWLELLTRNMLFQVLFLFPAMLIGTFSGIALSGYLNEQKVQTIISIILLFSGLNMIIQNIPPA